MVQNNPDWLGRSVDTWKVSCFYNPLYILYFNNL